MFLQWKIRKRLQGCLRRKDGGKKYTGLGKTTKEQQLQWKIDLYKKKLTVSSSTYVKLQQQKDKIYIPFWQCSGSGSAIPYLWLTDPDPALFVSKVTSRREPKTFFCLLFFEGTLTSFSKDKNHEKITEQQESSLFLLFFLHNGRIRIRASD